MPNNNKKINSALFKFSVKRKPQLLLLMLNKDEDSSKSMVFPLN